jgi:UDP-N-acetylglucosamine--N-acetylmuramyl-(pentapeptide) pyrophosphoryl-undecaprenol N-acetylglucosamine transferase
VNVRIACVGGGTGGHIFPGVAVIDELRARNPSVEVFWIGSGKKLEREILDRFGIPYYSVPSGKLRRYFSLRNFVDLFKTAAGVLSSLFLLRRLGAEVLFSKGGYVAVGPVIAAAILGIPVAAHESDRDPGLATRITARFARTLFLPYPQSGDEHFQNFRGRVVVTGNPIRAELLRGRREEGLRLLGLEGSKPLVLVLGGSQGAAQINRLIGEILDELLSKAFVVHQMGAAGYLPSTRQGYITTSLFHENFPHILAAADLVISRAGAGTLWESAVLGKPSILIPLGTGSSRGDQVRNAGLFVEQGAAFSLEGESAEAGKLLELTMKILDDGELRGRMAEKARELCDPFAAGKIADLLLSMDTGQKRG